MTDRYLEKNKKINKIRIPLNTHRKEYNQCIKWKQSVQCRFIAEIKYTVT